MRKRILSGMRPTGKLHLGHLVGALDSWVKLQDEYDCFFMVADWHALMSEYENTAVLSESIIDNVVDWLAAGIDPQKAVLFVQSKVSAHLDLFMMFSCLTPLGLLERCPTYKEQMREIKTRDLHTYGFLGYPVLQAADILVYKAEKVPVGDDQLPHLELTREIARRFNGLYKKEIFPYPDAILTKFPRLLGLDARKMSKSYNNTINLSDSEETLKQKVSSMFTDPKRIKLNDKGHPDTCNVFSYYCVFVPESKDEARNWCENANIGCTECKKLLAQGLLEK
ncbi:MAG: tryptophan--tRNA ligase, partial [Candidatus Omnitrophica bacterium]|nr:tryptophan--tRNA ligase [Candidatus Omnitrophota bacterium]